MRYLSEYRVEGGSPDASQYLENADRPDDLLFTSAEKHLSERQSSPMAMSAMCALAPIMMEPMFSQSRSIEGRSLWFAILRFALRYS